MLAWMMALWASVAVADQHVGWDELTPWRTYLVVEAVDPLRHWYVIDEMPGIGVRCEIAVDAVDNQAKPLVNCGSNTLGNRGYQVPPQKLAGATRRALDAASELTGLPAAKVRKGGAAYLGTLRRVHFRELVVVSPGGDGPREARSLRLSWDVDADTGAIRPGAGVAKADIGPVCMLGVHAGCDAAPELVGWAPDPGWDGLLIVPGATGVDDKALAPLQEAIRSVAKAANAGTWSAASLRAPGEGVLPTPYPSAIGVRLNVQGHDANGSGGGFVVLDLPLGDAVKGPVTASMPVDGMPATLDVTLDLMRNEVVLRIRPVKQRYVEAKASVSCELVRDGDRAALLGPCTHDWGGRWLSWRARDGSASIMVQLTPELMDLPGPSQGPGLIELPESGRL